MRWRCSCHIYVRLWSVPPPKFFTGSLGKDVEPTATRLPVNRISYGITQPALSNQNAANGTDRCTLCPRMRRSISASCFSKDAV